MFLLDSARQEIKNNKRDAPGDVDSIPSLEVLEEHLWITLSVPNTAYSLWKYTVSSLKVHGFYIAP